MLKYYYSKIWDGAGGAGAAGERRISLLRPAFLAALSRRGGEIDDEIEKAYWVQGDWEGGTGEKIAEWTVRNKVPAWPLLHALKEKVMAASSDDPAALAVRVREVAKVYEGSLGRVWELDRDDMEDEVGVTEVVVGGWKADSVGRAVSSWLA